MLPPTRSSFLPQNQLIYRDNTLFTPLSTRRGVGGEAGGISLFTPLPLGEGQGGGASCCYAEKAATLSGDSFHSVITSAHVRERH